MDLIAGRADANALTGASRFVYPGDADSSEDEQRWPLIARVAFIASTAAAMWAMIHLAVRPH